MELRQIRYFVAVADAGSFSAGARRAFVTQPTLSASIAALEAELGYALLERRPRGVALTERGQVALVHARAMLRQGEGLRAAGRPAPAPKPLRLGLLPTLAPHFVAAVLHRLAALDPARRWQAEDAPLAVLQRRLGAGRYDAVLTALAQPERGHCQVAFDSDSQALAVARGLPPGGPVTPTILSGRPLIVRTHCEQLQAASRLLDDWKVRPVVVARTDSDARALEMVAAGLGACLMPDSFRHDAVMFLRPEGVVLPRRLGLEWIRGAADGWLDEAAGRLA